MDNSYLLEHLQTDWSLPNWREVFATVRKQFWLICLIEAISVGGGIFLHWSGHPFLLMVPQMLLGLLLTLVYYRVVIDPDFTVQRALSGALALLPFLVWITALKMAASIAALFLFVLPGIYVFARLILAEGLVAADRRGISDHPIKASWKLTERHSGPLCALSVAMFAYYVLVMIAAGRLGITLEPSSSFFRGLLGLPAFAGWMGYVGTCSARAIYVQPKDLLASLGATAKPTGWGVWITRLLEALGSMIALGILIAVGVGLLGSTPAGGKVMRAFMRLSGAGGNVIIHGKTVLTPPAPWIANPEQSTRGSQAVNFNLMAVGGMRGVPQIHVSWLPISAPPVIDQLTAQRLSGLVVQGMDDLQLERAKVLRTLYDSMQRQLAEYRITGLSIVQNPDPHGWIIIRTRGTPPGMETIRDRFMPWDGGLLVFSDEFSSRQDAQTIEAQERPLIDALKL
jgi:hypothetical protein